MAALTSRASASESECRGFDVIREIPTTLKNPQNEYRFAYRSNWFCLELLGMVMMVHHL